MAENASTYKKQVHKEIDYIKLVRILFSRWYIIAGMVLLGILFAYLYLWYTPKTYRTSGVLKFEAKKSEISDLVSAMGSNNDGNSNIESEIFIIQSRNLLIGAIKKLDYRISFYTSEKFRNADLYPFKPLQIDFLEFDSLNFYQDLINYKPVDAKRFQLSWKMYGAMVEKTFAYNTPVKIGKLSFTLKDPQPLEFNAYQFQFNTAQHFLGRVLNGLHAEELVKSTNVLTIQQTDSNPQFAADILNAIMNEYMNYDRDQKTKSATQMIRFISEQQQFLSTAVKGSEISMEKYKQNSGVLDVNASAGVFMAKVTDLESQRALLKIQLMAIDQLKKQIAGNKDNLSLNFNMEGNIDPLLATLIANFNGLLADKNILLQTYNPASQPLMAINRQLLQVKNAALQNIRGSEQRILRNIDFLNAQLAQANAQVTALPAAERDIVSLHRDFEINEKVYSFLSEKKLEAQINRSAILPGATIIETALVQNNPVTPNIGGMYKSSVMLGLMAGIGLIVLVRVLNPYIYNKEVVESTSSQPIIGIISKFPRQINEESSQILTLAKSRSIFSESVRAIRTNLNFLAAEKNSKVICITSEVPGEGKSFVAINLASTLALIQKKVVIIGADLRRPKLHKTFGLQTDKGLSNYLINQCGLDDIIQHVEEGGFDFISAGIIPPNPSELLNSVRMQTLLTELRERYEIIILDTAPIGLVSDAIPLIRWSDINLFVIRYARSTYNAAKVPDRLAEEYKLNNFMIVLNAFEENSLFSNYHKGNSEQGTRYTDYSGYKTSGYYMDEEEKEPRWKRWFKFRSV